MPNYGLKYQCTFDPPSGGAFAFKPRYRLEILQKNYSGPATNVIGGETPVIHQWQTDDIKAPIRGGSLAMSLINKGSLPLKTFLSTNDDEYKVRFYWIEHVLLLQTRDNLLYEGFLVQDDCNEPLVDYTHEISLSSNDGLGLLKDVALNEAPGNYNILFTSTEPYEITVIGADTVFLPSLAFGSLLQVGDQISIDGSPRYTVKNLIPGVNVMNVYLVEHPTPVAPTTGDISVYRIILLDKTSLLTIIKICLSATGLELKTNIYCNLLEINHFDTSSFLDQTLIDVQTFLKDDVNYDNCYNILEKILGRFNLSLFQADGVWNIVRWDELRYYNNQIPGFSYDENMTLIGPVTMDVPLNIDPDIPTAPKPDTYPIHQLYHRIFRSFKYDKETFNYKQPPQLLRNFNLQELGTLRSTTFSGSGSTLQTIRDYDMPWWSTGFTWTSGGGGVLYSSAQRFIRVITDSVGNEVGRFAVIKGNPVADNPSAAASTKIEVNAGDSIKYSFAYKTSNSQPGAVNTVFDINLVTQLPLAPIGANNRYLDDDGKWTATKNFVHTVPAGENTNEWHTVEVTSDQIPFDGHLYIKLAQASTSNQETHFKDIRLEYIPTINQSTKIKGHTHTDTQAPDIKQNEDIEIFCDTSPRNSVVGTLFLNSLNGILQKLTTKWLRGHMVTGGGLPMERRNIGDITTTETLFWRRITRNMLEGSLSGLLHNSKHRHISLLSVMRYTYGPMDDLNFVPGKFELDYKHDMINNSTLWEQWQDGEVDADLNEDYVFKYIYETK